MKDIGSIFPLYDADLGLFQQECPEIHRDRKIQVSLCREALYIIAKSLDASKKTVLLPAYTCDTVITPFEALGWKCVYYPVNSSLRIDVQRTFELFEQYNANLVVVHPYYGRDLNDGEIEFLEILHEKGCRVAVDLTQCIFSLQNLQCVDYYVGSYRKWYGIPDGGFLEAKDGSLLLEDELEENDSFVALQRDAMYLRGLYFHTDNEEIKNISRRLNTLANEVVKHDILPHRISAFSQALLKREDINQNQERRFSNYKYLHDRLKSLSDCKVLSDNIEEVTSAPLYFTIYVNDRNVMQRELAEKHIYAPVLWPVVSDDVLINDTVRYIYDHLLAIPIDQRYDEKDMEKISEVIKKHYNG